MGHRDGIRNALINWIFLFSLSKKALNFLSEVVFHALQLWSIVKRIWSVECRVQQGNHLNNVV